MRQRLILKFPGNMISRRHSIRPFSCPKKTDLLTYEHTRQSKIEVAMQTGHAEKSLFLAPRSVVFIGVSRNSGPGSLNPVDNLRSWGYEGTIQIVHPHASHVAGVNTVPTVASLKGSVDLGIISTPRETIPEIVQECAIKGIKALIVTNQGFAEADSQGKELQRHIVEAARSGGTRILGPNTLGVSNSFDRFTSSFMPLDREEVPIGVVCQSGVFFVASSQLTGGVGMGIDVGNGCDLGLVEAIEWLGFDQRLKVLAIHAEGISEGARFLDIIRRVSLRIPVIAMKTGRSPLGALATTSHSGSMAGHDSIVGAAMLRAGVIRVEETQDMLDLVGGFLRLPPLKGRRIAVITLTGAGGIILLDTMQLWGLEPAELSHNSLKTLRDLSPPWMPVGNPMDIWPALMKNGMKKVYGVVLRDVLNDPNVDGVICLALGLDRKHQRYFSSVEEIQKLSLEFQKPIIVWVYGPQADEVQVRIEEHGRAMTVRSLERGVKILSRMAHYELWLQNGGESTFDLDSVLSR
jgi:acetate---CoA ligase (ADP-forming)